MQILCISGAFFPFYTLYQNLVISHGRSDIYMWCNIMQILVQIGVMLIFYRYGIETMVTIYTIFNILWIFVWLFFAKHLIKLRFMGFIRDIVPFMIVSLVVMVITYFATLFINNMLLVLISKILIASILYFVIMKVTHVKILEECLSFIHKSKAKKKGQLLWKYPSSYLFTIKKIT